MPKQCGYALSHADGSPIFYEMWGTRPGTSPSVALCDGIGCDGYVWKYLAPALTEHYRVLHWHYRGHGRTPIPKQRDHLAIEDLADDLATVLDTTKTATAHLIGHSMGVQVVLETFRRHRTRVSSLILLCGSAENPLRTFRGGASMEHIVPALKRLATHTPTFIKQLFQSVVPTRLGMYVATLLEVNPDLLKEADFMPYLRGLSEVDPEIFLGMLYEASTHSATDLLPKIDLPTLIIAGSRDTFTPSELSIEMQNSIPKAELLVVPEGSHTAPIERPSLVNDAVLRFLHKTEKE